MGEAAEDDGRERCDEFDEGHRSDSGVQVGGTTAYAFWTGK